VARSAGVVVQSQNGFVAGPRVLLRIFIRILTHHPVCGFAAATPPGQEG